MANFTFGSDPEFMIVDKNGKHRSAIGVVPGTKEDRVSLGKGHYAFYDNVLAEVNIKPGSTKEEVFDNFGDCFKRLANLVGDLRIVPQASQVYNKEECNHPDAFIFGCDPEFCIYNRNEQGMVQRVEPPLPDPQNTFRSAGGHIHIGHDVCRIWSGKVIDMVQWLDVFVGVPALCMDHDPTSAARRHLYGGAGTHRLKLEYGLEYRSLSNFWLASPVLVDVVYDLVNFVIDLVANDKHKKLKCNLETTKGLINSGNKEKALVKFNKYHKKHLPTSLYKKITKLTKPVDFDFYKEWKLR